MRSFRKKPGGATSQINLRKVAILVFATLLCVLAQSRPRSVKGIVVDRAGAPLPAAAVQIEDVATMDIRSFVTQRDGSYYLMDLDPDRDYKLRARYRNVWGTTKNLSRFDSRKEATVDLKIDVLKEE